MRFIHVTDSQDVKAVVAASCCESREVTAQVVPAGPVPLEAAGRLAGPSASTRGQHSSDSHHRLHTGLHQEEQLEH